MKYEDIEVGQVVYDDLNKFILGKVIKKNKTIIWV